MSGKKYLYQFYLWFPVFIWALVIFLFSSQPTTRASQINWQDFIIKKTAHIVEYAIFCTLLYRGLRSQLPDKKALKFALIMSILYGASDEYHQSFTPGREPTVRDVIFDTIGASLASFYLWKLLPRAPKRLRILAQKLHILS